MYPGKVSESRCVSSKSGTIHVGAWEADDVCCGCLETLQGMKEALGLFGL